MSVLGAVVTIVVCLLALTWLVALVAGFGVGITGAEERMQRALDQLRPEQREEAERIVEEQVARMDGFAAWTRWTLSFIPYAVGEWLGNWARPRPGKGPEL